MNTTSQLRLWKIGRNGEQGGINAHNPSQTQDGRLAFPGWIGLCGPVLKPTWRS